MVHSIRLLDIHFCACINIFYNNDGNIGRLLVGVVDHNKLEEAFNNELT